MICGVDHLPVRLDVAVVFFSSLVLPINPLLP